jgi:hypothetical protein
MATPLEELCRTLAKSDSALLSVLEILVATLVRNGRIGREDIHEWIETLEDYAQSAAKVPDSDGEIVSALAKRLNRSFFGETAHPQTRILH